jgi:hypothetical protein
MYVPRACTSILPHATDVPNDSTTTNTFLMTHFVS